MALEDIRPPRPMTHDLTYRIIRRLQGEIVRVVVHDLREQTFIGQVEIESRHGVLEIDARPSDAIALAVRAEVPIYASPKVLDQAAVARDVSGGEGEDV